MPPHSTSPSPCPTEIRDARPDFPSIKAKNPLIVHNQGISRQTPFFQNALHTANPPAGWGGPAVERSKRVPREIPLLGERIQVRASVTTNLPLCVKNHAIKARSRLNQGRKPQQSCLIKAHQGKREIFNGEGRARHSVRAVVINQDASAGIHHHE